MTYHVAGIDLSLTHSAVVTFRGDDPGEPGQQKPRIRSVLSAPIKTGRRDGKPFVTLLDRRNRIQQIVARVVDAALAGYDPAADDAPLFVIEAPLYGIQGSSSAALLERAWLFGLTCHVLFKSGIVVEVSTTTMKKYATGSGGTAAGSTSKAGVLLAMPRLLPAVYIDDDNEADAAALGLMGCRALDHPREPSPQRVTPAALSTVEWPTETARRARG